MRARAETSGPDPARAPLLAGERVALRVQRHELRRQDIHPEDDAKRRSPNADPEKGVEKCERLAKRLVERPRGRKAVGRYVAAVYGTVARAHAAGRLGDLARLVGVRGGSNAEVPAVIAGLIRTTCPELDDRRVAEFTGAARWLLFNGCLPSDARPMLVRDGVALACREFVAELAKGRLGTKAAEHSRGHRANAPAQRKSGKILAKQRCVEVCR